MYGTELLKRNADGESLLYLYNGHSDVTALMTSSGSVAASYYYDEFGSITETTGQANNPFRYAGYQYDEESELYYLNSRYYDPDIARFMQEDTYLGDQADPLSLNLYTYCANNPLVYVDPTGHMPIPAWLDWDQDGVVDTKGDRSRFDSNNDEVADWNQGKGTREDYREGGQYGPSTLGVGGKPTNEVDPKTLEFALTLEHLPEDAVTEINNLIAKSVDPSLSSDERALALAEATALHEKYTNLFKTTGLTPGAKTYITYYNQKYTSALNERNACLDAIPPDYVGAEAAEKEMQKYIDLSLDIKRLDSEGKVEGATLNVPVYNQYDVPNCQGTNLCWATSAAMWISYLLGDDIDRTEDIAKYVAAHMVDKRKQQRNSDGSLKFNVPRSWQSTDKVGVEGITERQVQKAGNLSMIEIQNTIDGGSPFAVLYGAYGVDQNGNTVWSGHWVLGIGYASAPGHDPLVVSNDPAGGVQRIQTYNDFVGPYVGDNPPWRPWVQTAR